MKRLLLVPAASALADEPARADRKTPAALLAALCLLAGAAEAQIGPSAAGLVRQAATDCTVETGGATDEQCHEIDADTMYVCETGPCDGSGWTLYGGGVDTGPSPDCSGTTTYQDGEANCDDIALVYSPLANPSFTGTVAVAASPTPGIDFDDSDDAGTIDGSFNLNCLSVNNCNMDFAKNVGGDNETVGLSLATSAAGLSSAIFSGSAGDITLDLSSPLTISNSSGALVINAVDNGQLHRSGVKMAGWSGVTFEVTKKFYMPPQTFSVADSGDGLPAEETLTFTNATVMATCNDVHGCDVTLAETLAFAGMPLWLVNEGANVINLADTAGVSETTGAIALGQWDTALLLYATDRWVMVGGRDN